MDSSAVKTRNPTVDEAVDLILLLITRKARRESLDFYRERIGQVFADQVAARVRTRWKKGKK